MTIQASTETALFNRGALEAAWVMEVVSPSNRNAAPATPDTCLKTPLILSSTPLTESWTTEPPGSSKDHFATGPRSWAMAENPETERSEAAQAIRASINRSCMIDPHTLNGTHYIDLTGMHYQ